MNEAMKAKTFRSSRPGGNFSSLRFVSLRAAIGISTKIAAILSAAALVACGGGGAPPPLTYALGGTAQGLKANDSVVVSDGTESLNVSANGAFQFKSKLTANTSATVSVTTQPASGVLCSVGNASSPSDSTVSFTATASSVSDVQLNCAVYPAFSPTMPQIGSVNGGTPVVIAHPKIVPVYFTDSPNQSASTAFLQSLVGSNIWGVLAQYGVGTATVSNPILIPNAAPVQFSQTDIGTFLKNNAASWVPTPGASTFFVFYIPKTTTNDVSFPCRANHSAAWVNGIFVPYAVIPTCYASNVPLYAEHEVMEGVADPVPTSGFGSMSVDSTLWALKTLNVTGVEIGDMCEDVLTTIPDLNGFTLQPIWSNAAATANKNPCVSGNASDDIFFGAVPVLPTLLAPAGSNSSTLSNHGVVVPMGTSVTIPVKVFSNTLLTGPISVSASAIGYFANPSALGSISFSFDKAYANNGDTLNLTINAGAQAFPGMWAFKVTAKNGTKSCSFPGGIANTQAY
jgi:hypothetical protein